MKRCWSVAYYRVFLRTRVNYHYRYEAWNTCLPPHTHSPAALDDNHGVITLKWCVWSVWLSEACNMSSLITDWGVSTQYTPTKDPTLTSDLSPCVCDAQQHSALCVCVCDSLQMLRAESDSERLFCCHIIYILTCILSDRMNVRAEMLRRSLSCRWIIANIADESWAKADGVIKLLTESSCRICQSL